MIELSPQQIAAAIKAKSHRPNTNVLQGCHLAEQSCNISEEFAVRAVVDSRAVGVGDLFFGLPGARVHGGSFAGEVLARGAWGVVVTPEHFESACAASDSAEIFAVEDPVAALGALANRWRHALGAHVIGVTGSTGKTSTKDILAALLGHSMPVVATPANRNTEIGLPLTVLSAPRGTRALVLEMAMRGAGQIDELAQIAEPDVGCIINVGPVHLEQLGSIEGVAAAKAELIAALGPHATAILPAGESLLGPHLRDDITTVTFGDGGDVRLVEEDAAVGLTIATPKGQTVIRPSFSERYLTSNLLAAVACAQAIGVDASGELIVNFSALRGEVTEVLGGVTLINDCYNANPVSMRAAIDNLAHAGGRRIAVLGGMGELGPDSERFHREAAEHAGERGIETLVTVGTLAEAYAPGYAGTTQHVGTPDEAAQMIRQLAAAGDTVLVKGSRSVGLERVAEALIEEAGG